MKKIGILGGTFNPVHIGHIRLAQHFYRALKLDKVLLIPDSIPPHKKPVGGATDGDRLEMLRLVSSNFPFMEVSDWEIRRGGKSYTYFTLEGIKSEDTTIYFLTGSDMFLSLETWYRYPEIMDMAVFCGAARNENDRTALLEKQKFYEKDGYKTEILDIPPFEISSSEIREKIKSGEDISEYLPKEVAEYISERKLYV